MKAIKFTLLIKQVTKPKETMSQVDLVLFTLQVSWTPTTKKICQKPKLLNS